LKQAFDFLNYLKKGFLTISQISAAIWDKILNFFSRYINRPVMSRAGLYDPTAVMNGSEMSRCQKEGWVKLAYYLLSFFFYLYR
jgi:hypothetical protein